MITLTICFVLSTVAFLYAARVNYILRDESDEYEMLLAAKRGQIISNKIFINSLESTIENLELAVYVHSFHMKQLKISLGKNKELSDTLDMLAEIAVLEEQ